MTRDRLELMARDPQEGLECDGTIRTGVDASRIRDPYWRVIEHVLDAFKGIDASVFVYGSVATGQARTPRSDIDILVVSEDSMAGTLGEQSSQGLSERFRGIAREIAIVTVTPGEVYEETRDGAAWRAFIKHYCACVGGVDLAKDIQPAIVSHDLAVGFAGQFISTARKCLVEASGTLSRAIATERIVVAARRTLLGLAPLVSVRLGTWTTDRAEAARLAAKLHPELADRFRDVLDIVNTGIPDDADAAGRSIADILEWAEAELLDGSAR